VVQHIHVQLIFVKKPKFEYGIMSTVLFHGHLVDRDKYFLNDNETGINKNQN